MSRTPSVALAVTALAGLLAVAGCAPTGPAPTAPASVEPTAAPSAAPGGEAVVASFIALMADPETPFVVQFDARGLEEGSEVLRVTGDFRARDHDAAGTLTTYAQGEPQALELVVLDGAGYGRAVDGEWQVMPGFEQAQSVNPFTALTDQQLIYLGSETRDGAELHHLRTTDWIGTDPGLLVSPTLKEIQLLGSQFDLFVQEDGVPVSAALTFSLSGTSLAAPVQFDYEVSYTFTDVGTPVTIEAPI